MERIAQRIVAHSRQILAATALITVAALLVTIFRIELNADVASAILEGNEVGEQLADLQEKYATADPVNVLATLPDGETFTTKDGLLTLLEMRDAIGARPGVATVASLLPEQNPLTGAPITTEALGAIPDPAVATLLATNPMADLFVSEDGQHSLLLVVPAGSGLDVARDLGDYQPPVGVEVQLSGNPVVFARVINVLSLFLLFIPPAVIVLLVVVFYANIGDRRLSALSLLPALLGALWTFGFIFALGREVDIVTVIVPIFVIVMGSADGLHFVTHFQDRAARTSDPVERVESALRHVGIPMILTTISTAAGFLSLTVTGVRPIQQMGLFAAIGITFAGIISLFSLPALLSRLDVQPHHRTALLGPRIARALKRLVQTRTPALLLVAGLVVFAAIGIPRLDVNSDQLFYFKDDDPIRQAFEATEELFGGATPLVGEFAYDPAAGPAQLDELAALSRRLEELPGVRRVFSVADLATTLPPEQLQAALAGQLELPTGDMVSDDGLRFMLLPSGFVTDDLRSWLDFAADTEQIRIISGMPVVWDEIARLVLRAQVTSLGVAFLLVFVMLLVSYRKLRQTLVSLVPIALTVATLLAFLAVSGIQLHLMSAVLSSIIVGVGIDYAIHFVAAIDNARRDGPGYVLRAIDRAGRPIVANALGIAVALSALWLSPLAIHHQVSMTMWVSMITGALTALVVIPALLPRDGVRHTSP